MIAGLPEIEIDAGKFVCSIADFRAEVRPQLSASDTRLIDLFYMKFDNRNLLRYLRDREAQFDLRGNICRDELEECLRLIGEDDDPANRLFPVYFKTFVAEYRDVQHIDTEAAKWENRLTELYYRWAMECDNVLISAGSSST